MDDDLRRLCRSVARLCDWIVVFFIFGLVLGFIALVCFLGGC